MRLQVRGDPAPAAHGLTGQTLTGPSPAAAYPSCGWSLCVTLSNTFGLHLSTS